MPPSGQGNNCICISKRVYYHAVESLKNSSGWNVQWTRWNKYKPLGVLATGILMIQKPDQRQITYQFWWCHKCIFPFQYSSVQQTLVLLKRLPVNHWNGIWFVEKYYNPTDIFSTASAQPIRKKKGSEKEDIRMGGRGHKADARFNPRPGEKICCQRKG